MMNLPWYAFFIRLLPESFLFILAGYGFIKKKVEVKEYLISGILFAVIGYLIKMLPLSLLIPQILTLLTCVVLLIIINKIDSIYAIISSVSIMITIIILEGINMAFINLFLKDSYKDSSPLFQMILGIPSLVILAVIIISFYFYRVKRSENYDALQKNC